MKRFLAGLVVGVVLASAIAVQAASSLRKQLEVEYSGISIQVNGKAIEIADSKPFIVVSEGRTYVPARPLAEALGATVGWDAENRAVVVTGKDFVAETIEEFQLLSTVGRANRLSWVTDSKTMTIKENGHEVTIPLTEAEGSGVSDTGVTVRVKVEKSRVYIHVPDLRQAGLIL